MSYGPMMDHSVFLIRNYIFDAEKVRDSDFLGPNSAIISDSCDYVGI